MIKILFVCHGNQCRSPMAEYMLKDMIDELKMANDFFIESAGTYEGIIGGGIANSARRVLSEHGINFNNHFARRFMRNDYDFFDYIVCMDKGNIKAVRRTVGGDPLEKICLLLSFPKSKGDDIADPMVTHDYEQAYTDILYGCRMLLQTIMKQDDI